MNRFSRLMALQKMMQQSQENPLSEEFAISSSSSALWRVVTTSVQTLSEDATFDVDANGLGTRAMDPSHVALLDVNLPANYFDEFHCPRPSTFTVNLEDFSKIIRRADNRERVEISRMSSRMLKINIGSGHYRKEFELHLTESGERKPTPLPRLTFTTRFSMRFQAFLQILSDISVLSTHLAVSVSNGSVVLSGKGDSGKVEVALGREDGALLQEAVVEGGSQQQTRAVYNLEYLLKITKSMSPFCDYVKLEYSSKMPLRLGFKNAAKTTSTSGEIQFYLAPKMME